MFTEKNLGMKKAKGEFFIHNTEEGEPRTHLKYTRDDVSWQHVTRFVMTWREKPPVPGDVTSRVVYLTEFF
jgi:hypothetical protein